MKDRDDKTGREELIAQLSTPVWQLEVGNQASPIKNRTLEDLARLAHARHKKGEAPGLIRNMETAAVLELAQIQELWVHLGLPI